MWGGGSWENAPGSPSIFKVGGQDQLITTMADDVVALDPNNGKVLWTHKHPTDYGLNIAMPVLGPDGILVVSSAYSGGARALQLWCRAARRR